MKDRARIAMRLGIVRHQILRIRESGRRVGEPGPATESLGERSRPGNMH